MKRIALSILTCLMLSPTFAQDSIFTGLENRVNLKLPNGFSKKLQKTNIMGPKPSDRDYVEYVYDKDSVKITITLQELYAKAGDQVEDDIKKTILNWSKMGTTFSIASTTVANDITYYKIVPEKLLTEKPSFVKEAYFMKLPDNSMVSTFTMVSKSVIDKNFLSKNVTVNMSKILTVGSRTSNKKGDEVKVKLADTTLVFTMPFDGMVSPLKGYSYTVIKVSELNRLIAPASEFSMYYGRHPQHILDEMSPEVKANIKKKKGKLFGDKVKWKYCYPKPNQNFWFMAECFYTINDAFYLHLYIRAKSKADALLIENCITQLKKE